MLYLTISTKTFAPWGIKLFVKIQIYSSASHKHFYSLCGYQILFADPCSVLECFLPKLIDRRCQNIPIISFAPYLWGHLFQHLEIFFRKSRWHKWLGFEKQSAFHLERFFDPLRQPMMIVKAFDRILDWVRQYRRLKSHSSRPQQILNLQTNSASCQSQKLEWIRRPQLMGTRAMVLRTTRRKSSDSSKTKVERTS